MLSSRSTRPKRGRECQSRSLSNLLVLVGFKFEAFGVLVGFRKLLQDFQRGYIGFFLWDFTGC